MNINLCPWDRQPLQQCPDCQNWFCAQCSGVSQWCIRCRDRHPK